MCYTRNRLTYILFDITVDNLTIENLKYKDTSHEHF